MFTIIFCTPSRQGPCTEVDFAVGCEGTRECSSNITAIQVGIGGREYQKHRNQQLVRSMAETLQSIAGTAQLCRRRSQQSGRCKSAVLQPVACSLHIGKSCYRQLGRCRQGKVVISSLFGETLQTSKPVDRSVNIQKLQSKQLFR